MDPIDLAAVRKALAERASLNPGDESTWATTLRFYDALARRLVEELETLRRHIREREEEDNQRVF